MTNPNPTNRRKFRFSLRTLMIVGVLLSLLLGWVGIECQKIRQERRSLEHLSEFQQGVAYRRLHVVTLRIGANTGGPNDDDLVHLKRFGRLEHLQVESSNVTDAGLRHIREIAGLKQLILWGTKNTDSGLHHLKAMTSLEKLVFVQTDVTAEGVYHLQDDLPDCLVHLN